MDSEATGQTLPIFVYGTLMIGQPNDYVWQECIESFESAIINDFRIFDFGYYPVMAEEEGGKVLGQLVRLEGTCYSRTIQNLDFLEGFNPKHPHQSNFRRIRVFVSTDKGENIEAWAYIGWKSTVRKLPLIEHGDWGRHAAEKDETIADWWAEIKTVLDDTRRSGGSAH